MIRLSRMEGDEECETWINGKDVKRIGFSILREENQTCVETYEGQEYCTNHSQRRVADMVHKDMKDMQQ